MSDRHNPENHCINVSDWHEKLSTNHVTQRTVLKDAVESALSKESLEAYDICVLDHFLSPTECNALIDASESLGYGVMKDYDHSYRGNLRAQVHDTGSFSEVLYDRVRSHLASATIDGEVAVPRGLNKRWRLVKYYEGGQFAKHCDNLVYWSDYEPRSLYTVNVYMNDDFEGGRTRFYAQQNDVAPIFQVVPKKGRALIFRQPPGQRYVHDGEIVRSGIKYLFRTDIMYQ